MKLKKKKTFHPKIVKVNKDPKASNTKGESHGHFFGKKWYPYN
jgi:hypothetical protein